VQVEVNLDALGIINKMTMLRIVRNN